MKQLISWIAYNNDFKNGHLNEAGPTYNYHKYFFNGEGYDNHIVLAQQSSENQRITRLHNKIERDFPNHPIEPKILNINDPIDLKEIKTKVEPVLLEHSEDNIDIFFSPGTSVMQLAWYICHTTLGLDTRLIQLRPSRHTASDKPERLMIDVEQSDIPKGVILKQQQTEADTLEYNENYLITNSIEQIYENAYKIAQTDNITTLIQGESGTGKEHLARYIHDNSIRNEASYLPVNCSAFSDDLLESRLFGFKKGAFTGAEKDTLGIFQKADGGTVFLDEIGDISPYMQQALLRVLQEKETTPVGGTPVKVDVRIIAATNKDLVQQCKNENFRWDLYYRLNVAPLELPSLQERGKDEIKELITFFIKQKKETLKKNDELTLSKKALKLLSDYGFPGNIRELENLIERLYVFSEDEVTVDDIPQFIKENDSHKSLLLEDMEKQHIKYVMNLYKGNQTQAAKAMGIALNTLKNKMGKYGLERRDFM